MLSNTVLNFEGHIIHLNENKSEHGNYKDYGYASEIDQTFAGDLAVLQGRYMKRLRKQLGEVTLIWISNSLRNLGDRQSAVQQQRLRFAESATNDIFGKWTAC